MDKFQTELLAQFKEHNRLTKELVKLQRADYEMKKSNNTSTEIFSAVKPKPAHWVSWHVGGEGIKNTCSHCGWGMVSSITYIGNTNWKYCPNCGAEMEMRKEGEENA